MPINMIKTKHFAHLLISSVAIIITLCGGSNGKEDKRINANEPAVPSSIMDIIKLYPKNDKYSLEEVILISFGEGYGISSHIGYKCLNHKIPFDANGHKLDDFKDMGFSGFCAVKYKDSIFQKEILFHIAKFEGKFNPKEVLEKLFSNKEFDKQMFSEFTDYKYNANPTRDLMVTCCQSFSKTRIKDSKKEQKPIELDNGRLIGYKVTNQPQDKEYENYYILTDKEGQYLYMVKSTKENDNELIEFISQIGKTQGLLDNDDFYNSFYTIPDHIVSNQKMTAYCLRKADKSDLGREPKTDLDKRIIGKWVTEVFFANSTGHFWDYELFDLNSKKDSKLTYKLLKENVKIKKTERGIYGESGFYTSEFIVFPYDNYFVFSFYDQSVSISEATKRLEMIQLKRGGYKK